LRIPFLDHRSILDETPFRRAPSQLRRISLPIRASLQYDPPKNSRPAALRLESPTVNVRGRRPKTDERRRPTVKAVLAYKPRVICSQREGGIPAKVGPNVAGAAFDRLVYTMTAELGQSAHGKFLHRDLRVL
jgi:hypothetical protein